ncbi:pimeloyl-ACP methyl ester carboxylesterase [Hasllibacter halocynthiae]|uniref:Pimeloyl-ACP methyl ester carboxylesterase n=1 Tax=Hasllibacter halocynthiae TaxID=595589 RepID=A0A2T0X6U0_9RHOB|nr:alpha/beta hydrolase [Hasllibacter halocynthiae]PRY94670.1 pimeloyl-ACP methyl ester carboxylesterase [Hasllibacter halocynthiae]
MRIVPAACAPPAPLVLLPGMMCDARLFAPQIAELGRDRHLHLAPITGSDRIAPLAEAVLEAAPPRFALAGLSMGGIVAMEVVRRAPERVERLCLMDTNPLPETPEIAASREPQIARVRAGRLVEVMRDEMKPNYLAPGPGRGGVLDAVMEMAVAMGPLVFERQSRALQTRPDQQAALSGYRGPSLVLCGRHDVLCPLRRHELMAALLADAELSVIEDAGHLPTLETPRAVNEALQRWLARAPQG